MRLVVRQRRAPYQGDTSSPRATSTAGVVPTSLPCAESSRPSVPNETPELDEYEASPRAWVALLPCASRECDRRIRL
jgi:hypothetical protein